MGREQKQTHHLIRAKGNYCSLDVNVQHGTPCIVISTRFPRTKRQTFFDQGRYCRPSIDKIQKSATSVLTHSRAADDDGVREAPSAQGRRQQLPPGGGGGRVLPLRPLPGQEPGLLRPGGQVQAPHHPGRARTGAQSQAALHGRLRQG